MTIITHLTPTLPWDQARAAYFAARGEEQLHDDMVWNPAYLTSEAGGPRIPDAVDAELSRLTDIRCAAEDVMIAATAPSVREALFKIEFARVRWEDFVDWPESWWNAVIGDLRRLSAPNVERHPLIGELVEANSRVRMPTLTNTDEEVTARNEHLYGIVERVQALPNTKENLPARAAAVCAAVDYTVIAAEMTLSELSAHAESNAGELVREILACLLDQVPA